MYKSFKTEIYPTEEQRIKINKTIGTCRYIYNFFIEENQRRYQNGESYLDGYSFSKWLNNIYLPANKDKQWIKEVSTKSIKQSILNADKAFKKFFKKQSGYPKFKKKKNQNVSMYFVKNSSTECIAERHRIKIPTIGWVRLKEKGYIPSHNLGLIIKSGVIFQKADRYYISVLVKYPDVSISKVQGDEGLGIDLGIKDFAILSNGKVYENINKSAKVKKLEKKFKREQRCLSRKYENYKKLSKKEKEEATYKNIDKQKLRIQKLSQRLTNIRSDYINKVINEIVITKPSYITIEDLNIKGMMKNKHLSKAIQEQKFYEFKSKLLYKSLENGIELRIVDRFYPSSKLCHNCGRIKKDLKLSDRVYSCECGYINDRDLNASLNLRDAKTYKLA